MAVELTMDKIEASERLYARLPDWDLADGALRRRHERMPGFDAQAALIKAAALDRLYATNVWAIERMARHVSDVLQEGTRGVEAEALVERLASVGGNKHWVFAAKFCHFFVDPDRFCMYDDYAEQMVRRHLGRGKAAWQKDERPGRQPHTYYSAYVANLARLRERDSLNIGGRCLDRYLWLAGQYRRWAKKVKASEKINQQLSRLFESASVQPDLARELAILARWT